MAELVKKSGRKRGTGWLAVTLAVVATLGTLAAAAPRTPEDGIEVQRAMRSNSVKELRKVAASLRKQGKKVPGYLEAHLWWLQQRAFPKQTVDSSAYARAEAHRARMQPARLGRRGGAFTAQSSPTWEFVGPRNLGVPYQQYYGQGTTSGRVNNVGYSSSDPGTYYVAAAGGGFWKSTDYGGSWTCLSDNWRNNEVSSIQVHPTDGNIVYVGTGDFDGGWSRYGYGIMKTTDGGATWTNIGSAELSGYSIRKIRIDPENPNLLLATTGRGTSTFEGKVWRSTNGGATWSAVINTNADWSDLIYSNRFENGGRFYYAVGHSASGGQLWRSGDRGATWTKLSPPLNTSINQTSLDLAASPTHEGTLYLLSGADRKIYKGTDSGNSWTDITNDFPNGDSNYNWSQSWYDFYINCSYRSDTGQDVLYVGLIDLVVSVNGGQNWQSIGQTYTEGALTHNDQHGQAINPRNPDESLIANDGGVYRLTFYPSSNYMYLEPYLNSTLGITQFYQAAYHPTNPDVMMGGSQDNATPVSQGYLWSWPSKGGGDGGFCAIDSRSPNTQYASSQVGTSFSLYRTTDGWSTSSKVTSPSIGADPAAFIYPVVLDPTDSTRLYAGTNYLWAMDTTTNAWTARLGGQRLTGTTNGVLTYIAVAPSDGNRIYTGSSDGQIWMSQNRGSTWTRIDTGSTSLVTRSVTSISVHPTNPNDILVGISGTGSGHLWRCADTTAASRTWSNLSGTGGTGLPDIPLNTVARDPNQPASVFYTGTDVGVFYTADGGATWTNATNTLGLPNVQVNDLKVVPGTGYLMAATFGRGIWRIHVSDAGAFGDEYEPDSSPAQAHWINDGQTQLHTLHIPQDSDWVRFSVYETGIVKLNTQNSGASGDLQMWLYSEDPANGARTQVGYALENGSGALTLRAVNVLPGTYLARIEEVSQNEPVTGYLLSLQIQAGDEYEPDDTPETATQITTDGTAQSHTHHYNDTGDWLRFSLPAGATVRVETFNLGGNADPLIELYDSSHSTKLAEDDDSGVDLAARLTYTVGAAGTYYARVRPYRNYGGADERYDVRVILPTPTASQLTGFLQPNSGIYLEWTDPSDSENGFELQRRVGNSTTWTTRARVDSHDGSDPVSYYDYEVQLGNAYSYRIRTYNGNAERFSNEITLTLASPTPPNAPSDFKAVPLSDKTVALAWRDQSSDETFFLVERATKATGPFSSISISGSSGSGSLVSYVDYYGLKAGGTYYYRVSAVNAAGHSGFATRAPLKVNTLKAGQNPFGIAASVTVKGKLNTDSTASIALPNPTGVPLPIEVSALSAPFTLAPTGTVTLPATGGSFTLTFRPTATKVTPQTLTVTSSPPSLFTIKIAVKGTVLKK